MKTKLKTYSSEVSPAGDYADTPKKAVFDLTLKDARSIIKLAVLVHEHDLYKVETFSNRVQWSGHGDTRTEMDRLNVTDNEYWYSAYLRHTNVLIKTDSFSIGELGRWFNIPVPTYIA